MIAGLVIVMTLIVAYTKRTERNAPYLQMSSIEKFIEESRKPKILLFHAPWCGYCKEYLGTKVEGGKKNTFETVASSLKDIQFETVDGDAHPELTSQYGIKGFPTIIAVNANGEKQGVFEGDRFNVKQLTEFAKSHLLS
jgi:thiol-disulfide isomerase/thioredoxin